MARASRRPHPEEPERSEGVSKDGHESGLAAMVRDGAHIVAKCTQAAPAMAAKCTQAAPAMARLLTMRPSWKSHPEEPETVLMLPARITLPHFSVSAAMSLPKSTGEPGSTVPPRST